jgi:hypothetical protein
MARVALITGASRGIAARIPLDSPALQALVRANRRALLVCVTRKLSGTNPEGLSNKLRSARL